MFYKNLRFSENNLQKSYSQQVLNIDHVYSYNCGIWRDNKSCRKRLRVHLGRNFRINLLISKVSNSLRFVYYKQYHL